MEKKIVVLPEKPTLSEMFDYLCSKVDWGKSALDNDAICCMNKLFIELGKQTEKYEL